MGSERPSASTIPACLNSSNVDVGVCVCDSLLESSGASEIFNVEDGIFGINRGRGRSTSQRGNVVIRMRVENDRGGEDDGRRGGWRCSRHWE